ncbi:hypothetical protein [Streptomyces odonnellii]|uniref:hypothetical protein n=1 Tax=Streptomyces odonnellii TaxID=1417980 RepID=UPI000B073E89|nr:hypothetical protein [Streptomyces odonnellii]
MPVTDEELAALPLPTAQAIEIAAFVPADLIESWRAEMWRPIGETAEPVHDSMRTMT